MNCKVFRCISSVFLMFFILFLFIGSKRFSCLNKILALLIWLKYQTFVIRWSLFRIPEHPFCNNVKFVIVRFLFLDHLERVPDIQMLSFIFKWSSLLAYQVMPPGWNRVNWSYQKWGGGTAAPLCPLSVYGPEIVLVIVCGTYNSNHQYGFA